MSPVTSDDAMVRRARSQVAGYVVAFQTPADAPGEIGKRHDGQQDEDGGHAQPHVRARKASRQLNGTGAEGHGLEQREHHQVARAVAEQAHSGHVRRELPERVRGNPAGNHDETRERPAGTASATRNLRSPAGGRPDPSP